MNEQKRSRLLSEFEKIIGYSSNEFREPDWIEFDGFIRGFIFAEKDLETAYEYGEQGKTFYKKDGTVVLPSYFEGVDG